MTQNNLRSLPEGWGDSPSGLDLMSDVLAAIDAGSRADLLALLEALHPADTADLIEQLGNIKRREFLELVADVVDGDVLAEIDEAIREQIIEYLPADVLAEAVREMDSDDVVDLVEDLDLDERAAILRALDDPDRIAVEQSLTYPEHSAGRLMQPETVTAPEYWTVGEAIDFLRGEDWLPDQFYHIILVDPRRRPIGYVTLGKMLGAKREIPLRELVEESFRTINVLQEEEEVAYLFNQYHLISAPVVDEHDRLVGVITIDDAMEVLDDEHEEDILRLAGVGEDSSVMDSVATTLRQRVPWLTANVFTALISASIISLFEASIRDFVALAILMPIVASMGGNAGTQTLTVVVRGLATKSVTPANAFQIIKREVAVGLLNGLTFALIMGIVAMIWFQDPWLSMVIGMAMVVNLLVAAVAGILVPLSLTRMGVDPALASGTFVTTLTDVFGFFAFLGLATMVLL